MEIRPLGLAGGFFVLIARNLIGAGANGERPHPEGVRTL
jgi:hypothetical protein